jgi:hypothetical protein
VIALKPKKMFCSFSGTIEIEFPEKRGILFIDSGEMINGEAESGTESKR